METQVARNPGTRLPESLLKDQEQEPGPPSEEESTAFQDSPKSKFFSWVLDQDELFHALLHCLTSPDLELAAEATKLFVLGSKRSLDWQKCVLGTDLLKEVLLPSLKPTDHHPMDSSRLRLLECLMEMTTVDAQDSWAQSQVPSGYQDYQEFYLHTTPDLVRGYMKLFTKALRILAHQTRFDVLVALNILKILSRGITGSVFGFAFAAQYHVLGRIWELLLNQLPSRLSDRTGMEGFTLTLFTGGCFNLLGEIGISDYLRRTETQTSYRGVPIQRYLSGQPPLEELRVVPDGSGGQEKATSESESVRPSSSSSSSSSSSAAQDSADEQRTGKETQEEKDKEEEEEDPEKVLPLWPRSCHQPGFPWPLLLRAILIAVAFQTQGFTERQAATVAIVSTVRNGATKTRSAVRGIFVPRYHGEGPEEDDPSDPYRFQEQKALAELLTELLSVLNLEELAPEAAAAVAGIGSSVTGLLSLLDSCRDIMGLIFERTLRPEDYRVKGWVEGVRAEIAAEEEITARLDLQTRSAKPAPELTPREEQENYQEALAWVLGSSSRLDIFRLISFGTHEGSRSGSHGGLLEVGLRSIAQILSQEHLPPTPLPEDQTAQRCQVRTWRLGLLLQALVLESLARGAAVVPTPLRPHGVTVDKVFRNQSSLCEFENVSLFPEFSEPGLVEGRRRNGVQQGSFPRQQQQQQTTDAPVHPNFHPTRALRALAYIADHALRPPFPELRLAGLYLLGCAAKQVWGVAWILSSPGLLELILRTTGSGSATEGDQILLKLRFRILERLEESPVFRKGELRLPEALCLSAKALGVEGLALPKPSSSPAASAAASAAAVSSPSAVATEEEQQRRPTRSRRIPVDEQLRRRLERAVARGPLAAVGPGAEEARVMDPITRIG